MNLKDIPNLRLNNQQLSNTDFITVKEIVERMCALQAQDYNMSKWAIGIRLPGSKNKMVEDALNKGEILRTHLLRPTWHIVSANDIYWLLELTASRIKASLKSRHRELELTENVFAKCKKIIEKALLEEHCLTKKELVSKLEKAKIITGNNRAAHIFLQAELDGLICSGKIKGKKQTYSLLEERVRKKKILNKDEALGELAKRYFYTRGPATLQDFIWWSGMLSTDAKQALEIIKSGLGSHTANSKTFWYNNSFSTKKNFSNKVFFVSAYDELIISYKDRSQIIDQNFNDKAISNNGIFRPTVVKAGLVMGLWRFVKQKDKIIVEVSFFKSPDIKMKKLVNQALLKLGNFWEMKIDLKYL